MGVIRVDIVSAARDLTSDAVTSNALRTTVTSTSLLKGLSSSEAMTCAAGCKTKLPVSSSPCGLLMKLRYMRHRVNSV